MFWLVLAAAGAVALYLLPLAALVPLARRRWPAPPLHALLDVPVALAVDLLVVLTLCFVLPLGAAAWVTRAAYLALALAAHAARLRRREPLGLSRDALRSATLWLAALALAAVLLYRCSYHLIIWDRDWHIPLVSLLRGERHPFVNVYLPLARLRYHYGGDVIAAMLQSLSGDRVNAALALTLAHDTYLGLTCGLVAALLARSGARPLVALLLGTLPVMFASPVSLTRLPPSEWLTTGDSALLCGETFLGYTTLAYRPHVVVAGFHIAAVAAALLALARDDHDPRDAAQRWRPPIALLACAAAMGLLDEPSSVLLAGALFAAHLVESRLAHPNRAVAFGVVAGMFAALALVNLAFGGSLGAGGAAQTIDIVPARHLALWARAVKFGAPRSLRIFAADYFPQYGAMIGLALAWLATRRRDVRALAVFYAALCVASWVSAWKIEVNHQPGEGHRFLTAAMLLAPIAAGYAVVVVTRGRALAGAAQAWLVLVLVAQTASGGLWEVGFIRHRFGASATPRERAFVGRVNPMSVDCRVETGPPRAAAPQLEYAEREAFYAYAGCQRARFAARRERWELTVLGPLFGYRAAVMYRTSNATDALAAIVCRTNHAAPEPVCRWATTQLACERLGRGSIVRCPLTNAVERAAALEQLDNSD